MVSVIPRGEREKEKGDQFYPYAHSPPGVLLVQAGPGSAAMAVMMRERLLSRWAFPGHLMSWWLPQFLRRLPSSPPLLSPASPLCVLVHNIQQWRCFLGSGRAIVGHCSPVFIFYLACFPSLASTFSHTLGSLCRLYDPSPHCSTNYQMIPILEGVVY